MTDIETRLQTAIALAQAGEHFAARRELQTIVADQPDLAVAWMWLATVSSDRTQRIEYLARALQLDPDNASAQAAYAQLTSGQFFTPPPETASELFPDNYALEAFFDIDNVLLDAPPSSRGPLILVVALLSVVVIALVMVFMLDGGDDTAGGSPIASQTVEYGLTMPPSNTPWGSGSSVRRSPPPMDTPGPSPTSVWGVPTWTPAPTRAASATWTPAPSSTVVPTSSPFIAPAVRSVTAAYVQTSDAPLSARQTATAQIEQTDAAGTAAAVSPTPTMSSDR